MRIRWRFALALAVLLAPILWATCIEPASLRLAEYDLSLPTWPRDQPELKVALISDLHVGSPFNGLDHLKRVVEQANAAQPDLVVLAGDFVITEVPGGTFVPPAQIADGLRDLHAPLGVHAVLGNHDWWLGHDAVASALSSAGIDMIDERAVKITAGAHHFWLVGIGDLWAGHPDVNAAMAGVNDGDPVLALTHNPDVFPQVPQRVSLTMAGHSHGGQVYFPIYGHPHLRTIRNQRYIVGHVVEDDRHLFVTPGIGTSVLPVRFLVPPEISLLRIRGSR